MLTRALKATFERRGTALPIDDPIGLTREFAEAQDNEKRWRAFIETNGLDDAPTELGTILDVIRDFVAPPLHAAAARKSFEKEWSPGAGWR